MGARGAFAALLAATGFLVVACGGDGGAPTGPPPDRVATVTVVAGTGVPSEDGVPTIEVGETAVFAATARNDDGDAVTGAGFTWSSLDPSVATVDAGGTATGVGPGEAGIVATAGNGVADTAALVVEDSIGPVASVAVSPGRDTVEVGSAAGFSAAAEDEDGDSVLDAAFTWSSLDPSVATVDADGTATGVAPGEAGIVATAGDGVADTAALVVEDTVSGGGGDGGGDGGENQPPSAEILEPDDGAGFSEGESIDFRGRASDPEDGGLPAGSLVWESDLDGELGTGEEIAASLAAGSHVISFTATDSEGAVDADTVALEVADRPDLVAVRLDLLPGGLLTSASASAAAVVANPGASSGSFRWSVSGGGVELASGQHGGLASGTTDTIPVGDLGTFASGGHDLVLEVDTEDAVSETDEGNNAADARLESRSPGFDIELQFVGSVPDQLQDEVRAERDRWERAITGNLREVTVNDSLDIGVCLGDGIEIVRTEPFDDLLVLVRQIAIDSVGSVLAQAGPCGIRESPSDASLPPLPFVSVLELDSADVEGLRSSGRLDDVILHEFGHALGFSGFMWEHQGGQGDDQGPHQLVGGTGADPRFVGPFAVERYRAAGGTGVGVPIETTGGSGTAGSHWRESVFDDEVMTGFVNFGPNPLSAVSIASFADMSYAVDLGEADPFTLVGGGAVKASSASALKLRERLLAPVLGVDLEGRVVWYEPRSPLPAEPAGER